MAFEPGEKVPEVILKDEKGNTINFIKLNQPFVVYFYPKDFTPGCTKEACGFRDTYEDFRALGAEIFGISSDSANSHKKFKEKYRLPFILLSDPQKKHRKLLG